jgi:hypothetical protein
MIRQQLAERLALQRAAAHQLQCTFGHADQAHAVVDAPRAEAALRDLEAAPFAEQQVAGRHAHVVERDFGVAVRRMVVAEH